jgi:hypothetical protein
VLKRLKKGWGEKTNSKLICTEEILSYIFENPGELVTP